MSNLQKIESHLNRILEHCRDGIDQGNFASRAFEIQCHARQAKEAFDRFDNFGDECVTEPATIYEAIIAAGIPVASHCSDLYLPDTQEVRDILKKFSVQASTARRFTNQIDGKTWWDIPFGYLPYWESKALQNTKASA